jgi:D-arabinose 1-dehydrogenase-like Zn-dependent alcohol dehydrogenase
MRAMAVVAYDEPLREIDMAEPEVPPGYALLDVLTCGVCFSDIKTARGAMPYSEELRLPHVPGHEIFGRVVRTNPPGLIDVGVHGTVYQYWPCGRCESCRRGDETLCEQLEAWVGFTHHGGFRDRLAIRVDRLIRIPPGIDPVRAAPMSCALGSAYRSVITRGGVRAGSRVVILGLGGVGIHAAQIARAAGASVVGFDVHQATLDASMELRLDARRANDPDAEVDLLPSAGGRGADVVVDTVGHDETIAQAARLVRSGGRIVGVGYAPSTEYRLPSPRLVLGEIEVVGSRYAHRDDLERAVALVEAGAVQPIIGMVRPLEAVNEVFEALTAGNIVGRAVLDVAGVTRAGGS